MPGAIPSRLLSALEPSESVLIAGAGGGFDVFSGLPLYFELVARGRRVTLANVSFSVLRGARGERPAPTVLRVTAESGGQDEYFPEKHLSQWFAQQDLEVPIYAFEKTGVLPLLEAYEAVIARESVDAIVLVDGGADILLRGDEADLGTPSEDAASLAAVASTSVPVKAVLCLGFGTDARHGVCHAQALEAVAELSRSGDFWGAQALLPGDEAVDAYVSATESVFARMTRPPSYVSSAILQALRGGFGEHPVPGSSDKPPWINPLFTLYWAFSLDGIAERNLYLTQLSRTEAIFQVTAVIEAFRRDLESVRPREPIPL